MNAQRSGLACASAGARRIATTLLLTCAAMTAAHADGGAPLVIKSQGSFFIGGESKYFPYTSAQDTPSTPPATFGAGQVMVNQMYVQFQVPLRAGGGRDGRPPLILVHGAAHSGAAFESTPDGREGWRDFFLRRDHAVYIVDQVTRARSGFDVSSIILAKRNADPGLIPNVVTFSKEAAWVAFRFGPTYGSAYPGVRFPLEAADQYFDQLVPDFRAPLAPDDAVNVAGLSRLLDKIGPSVLLTHSQSGVYGWDTGLKRPSLVKGIVAVEPRSCQVASGDLPLLAGIPVLIVFGDHVEESANWLPIFNDCRTLVSQLTTLGGNATLLHLPEAGVQGNTHMMMIDRNNQQVAGLIDQWIETRVEHGRRR